MSLNGMRFGGQHRSPLTMSDKIQLWIWSVLVEMLAVYAVVVLIGAIWVSLS